VVLVVDWLWVLCFIVGLPQITFVEVASGSFRNCHDWCS